MRGPRKRSGILKPTTPDSGSRSSGYSSSSSQDSLGTSPDGHKSRVSSAGYQSSRPSSGASVGSPIPRRRHAWGPELISVDTNPLALTCYEGSKHLHPERLPSARPERTTSLRLWENSTSSLVCLRGISHELLRLDLRKMKLGNVKGELVKTMECLQTLDLANNNLQDKSFDKECRNLATLVELRLDDNHLTVFPSALCIKSLRRVSLARNQIDSLLVLEDLKMLQILVLEKNRIKAIGNDFFQNLPKLQVLYFGENLISGLPLNIELAKNLRVLDLSRNKLETVPGELLKLPNLDELNLSGNKINRMPIWSLLNIHKSRRVIEHIDLSDNSLVRFPAFLLLMTQHLDLSGNSIKFVKGEVFISSRVRDDDSKTLDMSGNPTLIPPVSVCKNGIKSMIRYFQNQKADGKTYYGLKVYSIGAFMSGKSSLIQTILDQQSRLEMESERTDLVDIVNCTLNYFEPQPEPESKPGPAKRRSSREEEKTVDLSWWDFSGDTSYQFSQLFFLQHPALIILNVNMATYDKETFHINIGVWLEWLFSKSEQISMIVVGTKSDRIPSTKLKQQKSEIMEHIREYINRKFIEIEEEIRAIESRPHISAALSEQLRSYRNLTKVKTKLKIHPEVMATSARTLQGIEELRNLIQELIKGNSAFPKVLSVVPSLWTDVVTYVVELGNTMSFPLLSWPKFSELIVNKFGMRRAIQSIATYLQNTGKIIFLPKDITFSNYVVLRPEFLIEVLLRLYREVPDEGLRFIAERLKKLNVFQYEPERVKQDFEGGIADRVVLQAIWSFLPEDCLDEVTCYLMRKFEIGYPIGERLKNGSFILTAIADEEPDENVKLPAGSGRISVASSESTEPKVIAGEFQCKKVTRILLPWLVRTEEPREFQLDYQKSENASLITSVFRFPNYVPIGLFERFLVRVHNANNWCFLQHWKDGIMAEHLSEDLHLSILRKPDEERGYLITLEVSYAGSDEQNQEELIPAMWQAMMPVVQEMERFLESFPGAFYQRHVFCPLCHKLGFIGEWLAPKELQCVPGKACMECNLIVPTTLLVSPKEKRQLDLDHIRRERRLRRTQNRRSTKKARANSQPEDEDEFGDLDETNDDVMLQSFENLTALDEDDGRTHLL